MHTITFISLDDLAVVARGLPSGTVSCYPTEDGEHVLVVPDDLAAQAEAIAADIPAARKSDLARYAADRRYAVETAGILVGDHAIPTDRESQAMINGAYNLVSAAPQPVQYKTGSGFVTLMPEEVVAIALAVGQHVQACFAKEAEIVMAIEDGSIATPAEIDAAFQANLSAL